MTTYETIPPELRNNIFKSNNKICPICSSEDIDHESNGKYDDVLMVYNTCNDCESAWHSDYKLHFVHDLYTDENIPLEVEILKNKRNKTDILL